MQFAVYKLISSAITLSLIKRQMIEAQNLTACVLVDNELIRQQ